MGFSSEAVRVSAQTIRWRASHCCKRSLYPLSRHFKRPKPYLGSEDYMLTSTCQPHKINLFYTSPGEAHCIQIERKRQEQRSLNADIIETTRNSVLPSSEINSGGREMEFLEFLFGKFQNCCRCCRMLQDVARGDISRKWSLRTVRLPPSRSASSIAPERGRNPHFSKILCNVADAPVLAIAAETRYIFSREILCPTWRHTGKSFTALCMGL